MHNNWLYLNRVNIFYSIFILMRFKSLFKNFPNCGWFWIKSHLRFWAQKTCIVVSRSVGNNLKNFIIKILSIWYFNITYEVHICTRFGLDFQESQKSGFHPLNLSKNTYRVSFTGSIQDNWHSPHITPIPRDIPGYGLLWAEITYRGLAKKFPEGFWATLKPSLARHLSQLTAEFKEIRRSRFFFRGPWMQYFFVGPFLSL